MTTGMATGGKDRSVIVMKFGGSSIDGAGKVSRCVDLIASERERSPIVVVSAHGKTTNRLILAAQGALHGETSTDELRDYHRAIADELALSADFCESLFAELDAFLHGVSLIRELTARTLDHIMSFGERLSVRVVAQALRTRGIDAAPVDAFAMGLLTDDRHGGASPLPDIHGPISEYLSLVEGIPVVTGFLGRNAKGDITTLGRSGSDYTASIVGAAVRADEVQIWTDVSGIMTCDPSVDATARSLRHLSFDEASELAYYGAEVLHPSTLVPAIHAGIPVRVLNTMHPEDEGTIILPHAVRTRSSAKSIVYKEDVNLITIASRRLMSAVQILSRAFEILSQHDIGVHMATTSEATVSLVTDRNYAGPRLDAAVAALGALGAACAEGEKAIICVVGEELVGEVGMLGRIFHRLAEQGIKAKMVSQSSSEINIAFLVDNHEIEASVRALHGLILESVTDATDPRDATGAMDE